MSRSALAIVDVRTSKEFRAGHIQGALNFPGGTIGTSDLGQVTSVVVYCNEYPCTLSENAAQKIAGMGYKNVAILEGGLPAWIAKGYPMVKNEKLRSKIGSLPALGFEEAKAKLAVGQLVVIDVRSSTEFAAGHLPGARDIPLESMTATVPVLPKDKGILVYDRVPTRSRQAVELLTKAGYTVYELRGGYAGWVKRGNKVEVK